AARSGSGRGATGSRSGSPRQVAVGLQVRRSQLRKSFAMSDNETHEQGPNEAGDQAAQAADGTGTGRGWRPAAHPGDQPEEPVAPAPSAGGPAEATTAEVPAGPAAGGTAEHPPYQPATSPHPQQYSGYHAPPGYPAAAGYPGAYQGPEGQPTSFPTASYPTYPGEQRRAGSGVGRKVGTGVLMLAMAVGGGVVGGLIVDHNHSDTTTVAGA